MSKQLRLDVAQLTDVGRKRPHNEDNMAYVIPKDGQVMARKGALFIVADGMGGHAAGEVASEIAVDTVTNVYYQDDSQEVPPSLINAIRRANALIHQRAAENVLRSGMGTTCVAAVLRGNMAYIANVGDSRAYMIRNGQVHQITQDHSWVEEQVRAGLLTKEQARSHAQRNVITRSLGTQSEVDVDIFTEMLEEGDSLILCTDGLSGLVNEDDLQAIVNQYLPQESVYYLVERANENGGSDNITAIVVRVQEIGWNEFTNARYPVTAGGRGGVDEATAPLGKVPTSTLGLPRGADTRVPGALFQIPGTGPLPSYPNTTAPLSKSALPMRRKRSRLLYPTLALFIVLIVALVGSGISYFLGLPAQADQLLSDAGKQIEQAKQESTQNPTEALQKLVNAQKELRSVQINALSGGQSDLLAQRQNDLTSAFKKTISDYNTQGLISALPCGNSPQTTQIENANTAATTVSGLAQLQQGDKAISYMVGSDHILYRVDDQQKLMNAAITNIVLTASDNQHLFSLSQTGTAPSNYTLKMYSAGDGGKLNDQGTWSVPNDLVQNGWSPAFLTVSQNDVYLILTSKTTANQAWILTYAADKPGDALQRMNISTSVDLLSVAAEPDRQLFLLYSNGSVQSLQLNPGAAPVNVPVSSPINVPIGVDGKNLSWNTSIATPIPQSTQFLTIPGATVPGSAFLVGGSIGGESHLYVVDNTNHRVIDLTFPKGSNVSIAAPTSQTATVTPQATASSTKTPETIPGARLVRQYASPQTITQVNSMLIDASGTHLILLSQAGGKKPMQSSLETNPTQSCSS
ncbi:Stp1/IreP family PP2C-type Ser/Thr phosphatase [Tengunoibacter tsumagoiensis]|uniref:PPM-type phosphatase domain-containing protein n=1 Tax=Tengunoibacter tsumagoiensis TaxID=2014871 RepID=A0A401ZXW1_9CHLR|nr:Stp1/IreP family PP2C-type Ser/Thr phosphatase [Tengunoibacter tsumagoiensis]GCE11679.1 hypothetical protein KTT_15380 [Tengunoibacter tsumagoiensis]